MREREREREREGLRERKTHIGRQKEISSRIVRAFLKFNYFNKSSRFFRRFFVIFVVFVVKINVMRHFRVRLIHSETLWGETFSIKTFSW